MRARLHATWFLLVTLLLPATLQAQSLDRNDIPSSAIAAIFVNVKDALDQPSMELFPREIATALGKQEMGFDPMEINEVAILLDSMQTLEPPLGFAVTVKFDSPQTLSEKMLAGMEQGEMRGQPVWRTGPPEQAPIIWQPDDQTIVFGMESFVAKMQSAAGAQSELISLIESHDSASHIRAFFVMEPVRGLINASLPPADRVPPPFQEFLQIPDLTKHVVAEIDFSGQSMAQLRWGAVDAADAGRIDEILRGGIAMGKDLIMAQITNEMVSQTPEMRRAIMQYAERVSVYIEKQIRPQIVDNELVFRAAGQSQMASVSTIGVLTALLLPAVQQVREAARRTESMNNMRQIVLAAHNYESAHGEFPRDIMSEDGQPLLSWRVVILPYMEEGRLYEEFHLDEPWDSEHNMQLLQHMPQVFHNPNLDLSERTVYQAFKGPDTMYEGGRIRMREVIDGLSNTLVYVEADESNAIEWSRPGDLPFDPDVPMRGLGNVRPAGFLAAFADGSVRIIANAVDEDTLRNLIQKSDGNVVGGDF